MSEQITTVAELEALPEISIVLDRRNVAWQLRNQADPLWHAAKHGTLRYNHHALVERGPLTVLWRPESGMRTATPNPYRESHRADRSMTMPSRAEPSMARKQHVRRWLDAMATRPEEYSVCGRLFTSAVVLADGQDVPDSVTCKTCRKRWGAVR